MKKTESRFGVILERQNRKFHFRHVQVKITICISAHILSKNRVEIRA